MEEIQNSLAMGANITKPVPVNEPGPMYKLLFPQKERVVDHVGTISQVCNNTKDNRIIVCFIPGNVCPHQAYIYYDSNKERDEIKAKLKRGMVVKFSFDTETREIVYELTIISTVRPKRSGVPLVIHDAQCS